MQRRDEEHHSEYQAFSNAIRRLHIHNDGESEADSRAEQHCVRMRISAVQREVTVELSTNEQTEVIQRIDIVELCPRVESASYCFNGAAIVQRVHHSNLVGVESEDEANQSKN